MFFKSYDGWQVVGEKGARAVLATFTKEDGEAVHYNAAALRRKANKPSENMDAADKALIRDALKDAPSFFHSFLGWKDNSRDKKKSIMIASFAKAGGEDRARYGLTALQNWAANPPKKASATDLALVNIAIQDGPAPRR